MAAANEMDVITHQFAQMLDDESWTPKEDYYVHIDVLRGRPKHISMPEIAKAINHHMINNDSFDPRKVFNFPTDLLEPGQEDNLKTRQMLAGGHKDGYYELWKVRKIFSLASFREMVEGIPAGVKVRIVRFIDNDHDINVYDSIGRV